MAKCVQCGRQMPALSVGKKKCVWCVQHEAAQRGEVSDVQRMEPAPWASGQFDSMLVTQVIVGINVLVFVAMVLQGISPVNPTSADLVHWGANFGPYTLLGQTRLGSLVLQGQWWRLLSCVFLHIGLMHIALNMWCLWGLGKLAESMYGRWTFAAVYLVTGVSASVTSLAWSPVRISAGASGAIFGVAGALITSLYLGEFAMPAGVIASLRNSILKFAGYNLVIGMLIGRTDNAAHIGGLMSGLILGALLAKVAPVNSDVPKRLAVLLLVVVLAYGGAVWAKHQYTPMLQQLLQRYPLQL
jgi:rhomboid protease GluP